MTTPSPTTNHHNRHQHYPRANRIHYADIHSTLIELKEACTTRFLFEEIQIFANQQKRLCNDFAYSGGTTDVNVCNSIGSPSSEVNTGERHKLSNVTQPHHKRPRTASNKVPANQHHNAQSNKQLDSPHENRRPVTQLRTWTEMIQHLSRLVPHMTYNEHQLSCKLISICFLAYFAPKHSARVFLNTCGDETQLQSSRVQSKSYDQMISELQLSTLEQIMEDIIITNNNVGSSYLQYNTVVIQHEELTLSLWNLMYHGLKPFLASRPLMVEISNGSGVDDLLHVLAMAISPEIHHGTTSSLKQYSNTHQSSSSSMLSRAEFFMSSTKPIHFEVSYTQRVDLIHVLSQSLILEEVDQQEQSNNNSSNSPCYSSGMIHLRTSIEIFASYVALSNIHVLECRVVLSNMAIDTGTLVLEELKSLINLLLNETYAECSTKQHCKWKEKKPTNYQRFILSTPTTSKSILLHHHQKQVYQNRNNTNVNLHKAIGTLMQDLILRFNGARHYADGEFTRQALAEMTSSIATILGKIEESQQEQDTNTTLPSSSVVSSLLDAAKCLFYFLLNRPTYAKEQQHDNDNEAMDEDQMLEYGMKEALFQCTIQLMHIPNQDIIFAASLLLSVGFAYYGDNNREDLERHIMSVYEVIHTHFKEQDKVTRTLKYDVFQDVIKVCSRKSVSFAVSVASLFVDTLMKDKSNKEKDEILSLIAGIAQMQPKAVWTQMDRIVKLLDNDKEKDLSETCKSHIIAIIFSCRLSDILPSTEWLSKYKPLACTLLGWTKDGWLLYLLSRHAFCTGNFEIVGEEIIKKRLLNQMSCSSRSYLWYTTLLKVAEAESVLQHHGSNAIPDALLSLDVAINTLQSVTSMTGCSTTFQQHFLLQRKDMLQLCLTVCELSAEIELTNTEGNSHTRRQIHQGNVSKCFYMLANQYSTLLRNYGSFQCQQSRTALRSIFAICRFLGDSAQKSFCEASSTLQHEQYCKASIQWPKGDAHYVQIDLINKLQSELLGKLNESIQPRIRAESMKEIIDVLCKCSIPYPRCFMSFKRIPKVDICYTIAPPSGSDFTSTLKVDAMQMREVSDVIEVQSGMPFVINISGIIPQKYFEDGSLIFSQIVAFKSITFDGPTTINNEELDELKVNYLDVSNVKNDEREEYASELMPTCEHEIHDDDGERKVVLGSRFFIPVSCEPVLQEGYHYMDIKLYMREIRGGQHCIHLDEESKGVMILCRTDS